MRIFFVIALIISACIHPIQVEAKSKDFEKRVKKGVKALNDKITQNKKNIESGNEENTDYIVDVRSKALKDFFRFDEKLLDDVNDKLREFNKNSYHIQYYVLISDLYLPDAAYYEDYFQYLTQKQKDNPSVSIDELDKQWEEEITAYTTAVAQRSMLSEETGYGILENLESVLHIENVEKDGKVVEYKTMGVARCFALGNRLNVESIRKALRDLAIMPNYYGVDGADGLRHDVDYVVEMLNSYKDDKTFVADEPNKTIEGITFDYPYSPNVDLFANLQHRDLPSLQDASNSKDIVIDGTPDKLKENISLTDYANIQKHDPQFFQWFLKNFSEPNLRNTFPKIIRKIDDLKIEIITSSDYSSGYTTTAIQKVHESVQASGISPNTMLIGIHFECHGISTIRVHVTCAYSKDVEEFLNDKRENTGDYCWYIDEVDGQHVQRPCGSSKVKFVNGVYTDNYLGKYRAFDFDGNPYYNKYSTWYTIARWREFDKGLEANEEAADVTLTIIITVGSMGTASIEVVAANVTKEALKEAGKEFLKGAYIDWMIQVGINHFLKGESDLQKAMLEDIDYSSMGASGISEIVKINHFDAAIACAGAFYSTAYESGKFDLPTMGEGGVECAKMALVAYLINEITGGNTRHKDKLVLHATRNSGLFVAGLKRLGLNNDQIKWLCEKLGLDSKKLLDSYNPNNDYWQALKHFTEAELDALQAITPTGPSKSYINKDEIVTKALIKDPLPNSVVSTKLDQYLATTNTAARGNLGEEIAEELVKDMEGFTIYPCKLNNSNQGFDVLAIKGSLDSPEEIRLLESKSMNNGSVSLSVTVNKGTQMSDQWIRATIDEMMYHTDPTIQNLGNILYQNFSIIERYISTIDKGNKQVVIFKLDSF